MTKLLNSYDEQLAFGYTVYMMMGSYFGKTRVAAPGREKVLRLRYLLLPQKKQYELEEDCERYFKRKILPDLPGSFLSGCASVYWIDSKDKRRTAVVFVRGKRQLWVTALYGGRIKRPVFYHWTAGFPGKGKPARGQNFCAKPLKKESAA